MERKVAYGVWDFEEDGGAADEAIPIANMFLPKGALLTNFWHRTETAVDSAGDALTAKMTAVDFDGTSQDIAADMAQADFSGFTSDALETATGVIIAEASQVHFVPATADATAGKVHFYIEYLV